MQFRSASNRGSMRASHAISLERRERFRLRSITILANMDILKSEHRYITYTEFCSATFLLWYTATSSGSSLIRRKLGIPRWSNENQQNPSVYSRRLRVGESDRQGKIYSPTSWMRALSTTANCVRGSEVIPYCISQRR